MLSIQEYNVYIKVISNAMNNKEITFEEATFLQNRHACVKQSIVFGVSPRKALVMNEYQASVYNYLYAHRWNNHIAIHIDHLVQEAMQITNIWQAQLVMYCNISVNDAVRLCPDDTESSEAAFRAMEAVAYLPIEHARKFTSKYQIDMLKNIAYTKAWVFEEDINIALRFDEDYYYLFELLCKTNEEALLDHQQYLALIAHTLTFRNEQISILKLMMNPLPGSDIEKPSIESIIDIVRMLHPDNNMMQHVINGIRSYTDDSSDSDMENIYLDIMNDMIESEDLYSILETHGFIITILQHEQEPSTADSLENSYVSMSGDSDSSSFL